MPYVCVEHGVAYNTWPTFCNHWQREHHDGEPRPEKETVYVEELPEGISMVVAKYPKQKPKQTILETPPETVVTKPPAKPKAEIVDIPEDFWERVDFAMEVQGIPDSLRDRFVRVLRLHPEAVEHPTNFANLLNHIFSSTLAGRQHLSKLNLLTQEVFGVGAPPQMPYFGYQGGPQPTYGGYPGGYPGGAPGGSPGGYPGGFPGYQPYISQPPYWPRYDERQHLEPPRESSEERKENKELNELKQQLATQERTLDEMRTYLAQSREEAKEAERKREMERLEAAHRGEIETLRQEQARDIEKLGQGQAKEMERLTASLGKLEGQLAQGGSRDTDALRAEIAQLRDAVHVRELSSLQAQINALEERGSTGSTEMDVIKDVARSTIEAAKQAGTDLKSIALGAQAQVQYPPGRRTLEERTRLGQELASKIGRGEEVMSEADQFFKVP